METDYNALSQKYQQFIDREKAYNTNLLTGQVDWYDDVVTTATHFVRTQMGNAAKKEESILKRVAILNAFEHVAAMQRAHDLRKLDYSDFFGRQDVSLADDNSNMQKVSNFFNNAVNIGAGQTPTV